MTNPNGKSEAIQKFYNVLADKADVNNKYNINLGSEIQCQIIDSEEK